MKTKGVLALLAVLAISACSPLTAGRGEPTNGAQPGALPAGKLLDTTRPDTGPAATRGPGDFDLADARVGLQDLGSYRQSLELSFDGTINGQETHTFTSMQRVVQRDMPAELTRLELNGLAQLYGTAAGLSYQQSGDGECSVMPASEAEQQAAAFRLEQLPPVRGAWLAGEETLNGILTRRYTFDQQAISQPAMKAVGEMWIAVQGGYVVRYVLQLEGETDALGPGVKGVQRWVYELSEPDAVASLDLPESCPQASEVGPLPPGAVPVQILPGFVEYQAAGTLYSTLTFYEQAAAGQGWLPGEVFRPGGEKASLSFGRGDGALVYIQLEQQGEGVRVGAQLLEP